MFTFLGNTLRSSSSSAKDQTTGDENSMMMASSAKSHASSAATTTTSSSTGRRVLGEITNNIIKPTTKRRAAAKKATVSIARSTGTRSVSTRSQGGASRASADVSQETHVGAFGTTHTQDLEQRITRRRIVRKDETQLQLQQQQQEEAARQAAASKLAVEEAKAAAAAAAAARPDDVSMLDTSLEDIDAEDRDYPEYCSEYVKEIFEHLREKEVRDHIGCGAIAAQVDLNESMYSTLLSWCVGVHMEFRLLSETLFLSADIINRFLAKRQVPRQRLQLVAIAAMLVASKTEETVAPYSSDFCYMAAMAFTKDQVLEMENVILDALDFHVVVATPLHFLRRFSKAARSDPRLHTLCKYFIELTIPEYSMQRFLPSKIAASAVFLARQMARKSPSWNSTLEYYTAYSEADLQECVAALIAILKHECVQKKPSPVTTKYSRRALFSIAPIALKYWKQVLSRSQMN
eukprot:CAMPEP_0177686482 /NCGR_PEP_ID=MMETSP0447-20121125/33591_1 /TAXON_ID=0 /ORGANISM="Stygamoeba regulata, Strain BSH-02190019" /LENGTH=461 /DNA_ID=CAMNT_0019196605 /DNA_START=251 /DNA_END=1637 /DNA_ORIENTATION=-